jgi:hypothetical protein
MATPIKITPILKGKDAAFFNRQLAKSSKRVSRKKTVVSESDRLRISATISKLIKSKAA